MFGLIRSSTHRKIYVRQGEAYRREIEQARAEARATRTQLREALDAIAPHADVTRDMGGIRIMIELDPHLMARAPSSELVFILHRRLMDRLLEVQARDWRGDLRQTETQRMLMA